MHIVSWEAPRASPDFDRSRPSASRFAGSDRPGAGASGTASRLEPHTFPDDKAGASYRGSDGRPPRLKGSHDPGGVAAAGLELAFGPSSAVPNLGASGAIAAVLGSYLVLYPRAQVRTLLFGFIPVSFLSIDGLKHLAMPATNLALFNLALAQIKLGHEKEANEMLYAALRAYNSTGEAYLKAR